ncbi:MAG: L,D-transpeptidase [Cellulosilyticaceae bacterium]
MKSLLSSLMLIVCIMIIWPIHAMPYFQKVYMGPMSTSRFELEVGGESYPIYECLGALFIPVEYVRQMPYLNQVEVDVGNLHAYISDQPVQLDNLRTFALEVGGHQMVPLQVLYQHQQVVVKGSHYVVEPLIEDYSQYFTLSDQMLTNCSDYPIWVGLTELYLKDQVIDEKAIGPILLESGQAVPRKIDEKKGIYLSAYVTKVNEWEIQRGSDGDYGQCNRTVYERHYNYVRLMALEKLFPPFIVKGKINYATGPFEKGDEVEIWRSEKNSYVVIRDKNGKKYNLYGSAIDIPSETWIDTPSVSTKDLEEYMNLKRLESATEYFVWTDLSRQRTHVFKGSIGAWKLEKTMLCSSGKNHSLTPRGLYKALYKVPYFGEARGFRCKHGIVIYRDYMYHSILFDKTGKYPKESVYQLGQRRSHGCIRLSESDSQWLYQTVPMDTTVWIN